LARRVDSGPIVLRHHLVDDEVAEREAAPAAPHRAGPTGASAALATRSAVARAAAAARQWPDEQPAQKVKAQATAHPLVKHARLDNAGIAAGACALD